MRLCWLRFNLHFLLTLALVMAIVGVGWGAWPMLPGSAVAILLALLLADAIARPSCALLYPTVVHGPRDSGAVALSFDDGPDPLVTPQVLDALAACGARATFFVIGRSLAKHPGLARRMVAEGHALGNHSWQHSRLQNFRFRRWHREEIARCEKAIAAVAGEDRFRLYRPPVGLKIGELCRELWHQRLTLVAWSLHSRDTRAASPQQIAERVLARVRGGDIVLLHDGHDRPGKRRPLCADAVPLILQGLQRKGLECVTIPELLPGTLQRT
ncbi:MAG: polysaccharide deacetylase family protein [Salinisphaera sp.]|nr:polysaccharide deacetylase family protein [Salinisphaera sp.]